MAQANQLDIQQSKLASQLNRLELLLHLKDRAIEAQTVAELLFVIVNETMNLTPYRQAGFFEVNVNGQPKLTSASGLVSVEENSPYTVWLNGFARTFKRIGSAQRLSLPDADAAYQEGWQEWLPAHLLVIPLRNKKDKQLGYVFYAREAAWQDAEIEQLTYLHDHYSYCLNALKHAGHGVSAGLSKIFSMRGLLLTAAVLVALMFVPVRLSTLAPSEVIAFSAFNVASPQEGVVHSMAVKPNAMVKKGDLLFTLDDTSISNRYEVAVKALATAKADALVAEQRAFDDLKSRAELAGALGRVREKEAELAAAEALRMRVEVRAERDGIAVFSDENDWIGRPVQTGERVLQIANPEDAGLLVWLPAHDALNLEADAPMRLFLHTQPLKPIEAKLTQTSYQVVMSPENIASYRLKGLFIDARNLPRIGLRGTTRISGEWSVLGYYLFRRPIATLREWTGL